MQTIEFQQSDAWAINPHQCGISPFQLCALQPRHSWPRKSRTPARGWRDYWSQQTFHTWRRAACAKIGKKINCIQLSIFLTLSLPCLRVVQLLPFERCTHWVLLRYWQWCSAQRTSPNRRATISPAVIRTFDIHSKCQLIKLRRNVDNAAQNEMKTKVSKWKNEN